MCRLELQKAAAQIAEMKAAGASRVVALVKEDVGTEVADLKEGFWPEELFLDQDQSFYRALGGGEVHKPFGLTSFMAMLANPFSKARTKAAIAEAKPVKANLIGEGFVQGGVYVIRPDGKAEYAFLEAELGDRAPLENVIEAVRQATQ